MQGRIKHEQIIIKIGVMLGLLWLSALPALSQDLGVIPEPQAVERTNEFFWLDESTLLVLGVEAGKHERFAVAEFQDALRNRLNLNLALTYDLAAGNKPNSIVIGNPEENPKVASRMDLYGLSLTEDVLREGYVLGIGKHGVVIGAHSSAGILYGTITLKQIIFSRGSAPLPGVKIRDWPFFAMRGIQDEISYGQVSTMENFKDIIRFLAEFKMNTFMIYLEDTFRFEAYPTIGIGRGALTREQVDELEAFAKPYNVEIIPIFEMLANQGALLMLDEIRPLAEYPGAHSFAISEDSYEFFENCTRELSAAFDSNYFHAGLDESWDLGYGRTEELVKQKGKAVVHAEHYRRLNDMLKRYDKKMMMYSDIVLKYAHILELIPKDIVLMYWKYAPWDRYPEVVQHVEKGFELVVLPGMNNWNQFFPTMSAAMINIKNLTLEAAHYHALGSITSTWGDYGSKNLRELLYCGYAYQGEVAWSPQTHDVSDFNRRFFTLRNGPGTSAYFIAIYELLEKWPVLWHKSLPDYFRHPFLPRKKGHKPTAQELYRVYHNA